MAKNVWKTDSSFEAYLQFHALAPEKNVTAHRSMSANTSKLAISAEEFNLHVFCAVKINLIQIETLERNHASERIRLLLLVTSIIVIKLLLFLKWIYFPVTLMSVSLEYQFIYTSTWINLILHSLMKCISAFVCTRRRPPCAWGRIWSSSVNRMGMEHDVPSVNVFVYVN